MYEGKIILIGKINKLGVNLREYYTMEAYNSW